MTHTSRHQQPRKIAKLALIATATVAATIALPATAHARAGVPTFQSPSGNIACFMNEVNVLCYVVNHTYAPAPGDCDVQGCDWAAFDLMWGKPPELQWHGKLTGYAIPPVLDYGQTHTVGTITCDSEPSGVTCTDTSTGHFFRVSQESYQLG